MLTTTHEQNISCSKTEFGGIAHEDIICRQIFAGHMVGFRSTNRKKELHRMILNFNSFIDNDILLFEFILHFSFDSDSILLAT